METPETCCRSVPGFSHPFRVFFPWGVAYAVWGTAVWIMLAITTGNYPGALHADLMTAGFLGSFVVGLMLTTVPPLTESLPPQLGEVGLFVCWDLAFICALILGDSPRASAYVHLFAALKLFSGLAFTASRIVRHPEASKKFIWALLGLTIGVVGVGTQAYGEWSYHYSEWTAIGRNYFIQGLTLSLLMSLGKYIFPQQLTKKSSSLAPWLKAALMILFFATFVAEPAWMTVARCVRAFTVSVVAVREWGWPRGCAFKKPLALSTWLGTFCIIIGLWGNALFPDHGLHFMHLMFIGGWGLMLLTLGLRVRFAEVGDDVLVRQRGKFLTIFISLVALAAVTRATVWIKPESTDRHLAYAAGLFIVALILWSYTYRQSKR